MNGLNWKRVSQSVISLISIVMSFSLISCLSAFEASFVLFLDEADKLNPASQMEREPTESSFNKKKKPSEAPKPLQYFHYSYHLIPPEEGDEETQADVVTFPSAVKVYGKGAMSSENPGVKSWREGDRTWFAFQHK